MIGRLHKGQEQTPLYPDRSEIQHPLGAEFLNGDLNTEIPRPTGVELTVAEKGSPVGEEFKNGFVPG